MIGSTRSVRVFADHLRADPLSGDLYLLVAANRKRAKVKSQQGLRLDSRTGWTRWVVARLIVNAPPPLCCSCFSVWRVSLRRGSHAKRVMALTIADLLSIVFAAAQRAALFSSKPLLCHRLPPLSVRLKGLTSDLVPLQGAGQRNEERKL